LLIPSSMTIPISVAISLLSLGLIKYYTFLKATEIILKVETMYHPQNQILVGIFMKSKSQSPRRLLFLCFCPWHL
jgi:hypothetical protein